MGFKNIVPINRVLCIASCGKEKIWKRNPQAGPTKAKDVYVDQYAGSCIAYAETFFDSWCILSAKYGFVFPEDIIPGDYNVTFNDRTANPITIDRLSQMAVEKKLTKFNKVVIIAGQRYVKMAKKVFPDAQIFAPLKGIKGNGKQSKILRQAIKKKRALSEKRPIN